MSGITMVVLGGLLATAGALLGGYGWKKVDSERQILSLSVAPSIDVALEVSGDELQDIVIRNTGPHELVDVTITPVSYLVQRDPIEILQRSLPGGGFDVAKQLAPGGVARIPAKTLTMVLPSVQDEKTQDRAMAAVVVFRRKADNHRYVEIEPYFVGEEAPKKYFLLSMFAGKGTSSGGAPARMMKLMKDILEGERFYFNAR